MPLDLRLIPHAPERESIELAIQRRRDGTAQRRLANTGGTDEEQDGPGDLTFHLAHTEELQDAFLDVLQALVVAVQHARGMLKVEIIRRVLVPGQAGQPVQVIAGHGVLRRTGFKHRHLLQLLVQALLGRLRYVQFLDALLESVDLRRAVVFLDAEFFLDELQLLAQEHVALSCLHLVLDVLADLHLRPGDL